MALRINSSTYYIVPGPSKDHLMTINGTAISASSFDRILNQECRLGPTPVTKRAGNFFAPLN